MGDLSIFCMYTIPISETSVYYFEFEGVAYPSYREFKSVVARCFSVFEMDTHLNILRGFSQEELSVLVFYKCRDWLSRSDLPPTTSFQLEIAMARINLMHFRPRGLLPSFIHFEDVRSVTPVESPEVQVADQQQSPTSPEPYLSSPTSPEPSQRPDSLHDSQDVIDLDKFFGTASGNDLRSNEAVDSGSGDSESDEDYVAVLFQTEVTMSCNSGDDDEYLPTDESSDASSEDSETSPFERLFQNLTDVMFGSPDAPASAPASAPDSAPTSAATSAPPEPTTTLSTGTAATSAPMPIPAAGATFHVVNFDVDVVVQELNRLGLDTPLVSLYPMYRIALREYRTCLLTNKIDLKEIERSNPTLFDKLTKSALSTHDLLALRAYATSGFVKLSWIRGIFCAKSPESSFAFFFLYDSQAHSLTHTIVALFLGTVQAVQLTLLDSPVQSFVSEVASFAGRINRNLYLEAIDSESIARQERVLRVRKFPTAHLGATGFLENFVVCRHLTPIYGINRQFFRSLYDQ
jgi:hypothetical protein